MATTTQELLTCDVCGESDDVHTQTFGLDGKSYEVDLCREDSDDLTRIVAGYIGKAREVSARRKPRRTAGGSRRGSRAAGDGAKADAGDRAKADAPRILVYGVLPGDSEVADETPGVGEQPGPLRIVHSDGLAALISDLGPSGQLGTPDDREAYREILDVTAMAVPVVPLRFGTVLASEDAVADELLDVRHDDFAGALEDLDGRVEFVVKGRYAGQAASPERAEAIRVLAEAMQQHCVASVVREPDDERDAGHVAFLVSADAERDVERVIEDLAEEWAGQIELELRGPTAAYDFVDPGAGS